MPFLLCDRFKMFFPGSLLVYLASLINHNIVGHWASHYWSKRLQTMRRLSGHE